MTVALIYHDVVTAPRQDECGFPGPVAARYKLEPERFEAHLDAIAATGVTVGLIGDGSQTALTFDDGGASALRRRRGARTARAGGATSSSPPAGSGCLGSCRRRRSASSPTAATASAATPSPTRRTWASSAAAELADEWRSSRAALSEILGAEPDSAAVPGGFLSAAVIDEAAKAGYGLLTTSQPTVKPDTHKGMRVQGRFTIWSTTVPSRAAAYARGDRLALASIWLAWQAKSAPKRVSPKAYEALRRRWARAPRSARR